MTTNKPWHYEYGRVKLWLSQPVEGTRNAGFIFLACSKEPTRNADGSWNLAIVDLGAETDTLGWIDWSAVVAVTWRPPLQKESTL